MSRTDTDGPRDEAPAKKAGLASFLASVPFAASVIAIIAVACIVGTLLPQGEQVADYLQEHPENEGQMELLAFLGLTNVFSAPWFIGLLGLLAASLSVCTYRRVLAARGKQGKALGRVWGSVLTHISLLLILGGGVVRGIWGERGDISFREGDTTDHFVVNRSASKLPFSVTLEKFEIETYSNQEEPSHPAAGDIHEQLQIAWKERNLEWTLPIRLDAVQQFGPDGADRKPEDSFQLTILRRITDFVVDMDTGEVTSRSDAFNNPAILVEVVNNGHTNAQWAFARYPDFNMHSEEDKAGRGAQLTFRYEVMVPAQPQATVKDYKSTLVISEDGVVVRKKTIEVNAPLSYRGYTFYQSGYNPKDPKWTSLQVVRDPGVPIVYAGFGFMILGLIAVFYVCPGGRPATRPGVTKEGASSDDTI